MALEPSRFTITVNAVAPGFTVTEMTGSVANRMAMGYVAGGPVN